MDTVQQFREVCAAHKVPGAAMALMHQGELIAVDQHGIANTATGVAVDESTLFHIGSNTKIITATLIMQAVDEGLIALDDPVQRYLPDFTLADNDAARSITVKMLINHTSGIDCDMIPQAEFDQDRVVDGYRAVLGAPVLFPPGEAQAYSNGATLVAGHLIQTLRQRGWYELVRERIFEPLEMDHAIAHPSEALAFRFAKGHVSDPETGELLPSERAFLPSGMAPAGATLSMTAENQVRFAAMHNRDGLGLNGVRVLSEAAARQMRSMTTQSRVGGYTSAFGLGWGLGAEGMGRHTGGGIGTCAQILAHAPSGTVVSLMGNSDTSMAALAEFSQQWLQQTCGIDMNSHHQPLQVQPGLKLNPEAIVGRYASALCWWDISYRDDQFRVGGGACVEGVPSFKAPAFSDVPLQPLDANSFKASLESPERLGTMGLFLTMPVGFAGDCGDGRRQRFMAGGRVYARVD